MQTTRSPLAKSKRQVVGTELRGSFLVIDAVVVTELGRYFLPMLVVCALLRARWLLPLAFVAAVLQSPAVLVVRVGTAKFGVTPFNAVALFIALHLLWLVARERRIEFGSGRLRLALTAWCCFTAVSVAGALLLPRLFAGMPVFLLADINGFDYLLTPLRFSVVNFVQAANSLIMLMLFVYVLQLPERTVLLRRCLWGLCLALVVSLGVGGYQRLAWIGVVAQPNEFWASNPSYVQMWQTPFGPMERVSFPFVEPSFASAWFAAMAGGMASLFFFGKRWWLLGGLAMLACLLALLNTLGFTGILAFLAFAAGLSLVVVSMLLLDKQQRRVLLVRSGIALGVSVIVITTTIAFLQSGSDKANVTTVWSMLNAKLAEVADSGVRARSNQQALVIARDSYGLGVGSGSNRASNYFLSLLTNTGLAGVVAFLFAVTLSWVGCARARDVSVDVKAFVLGTTVCMLVAVAGGIPDQNWPPLWILLLTIFCACAPRHEFPGSSTPGPLQTAQAH